MSDVISARSGKEGSTSLRWLRSHPYLVGLNGAFMIVSMVMSPIVFPSADPTFAVLGGALFGMLCTLCATMHMFFD